MKQLSLAEMPSDFRPFKNESLGNLLSGLRVILMTQCDCVSYAVNRFLEPFTECASVSDDKDRWLPSLHLWRILPRLAWTGRM